MTILPAGDCEGLGVAANSAAEAMAKKSQKLDKHYDRKTGHGRRQSVTLP
jgi:hypothetical protein